MKKITKAITTLSLAGAVLGATAGLGGCTDREDELITLVSNENVYIVVSENEVNTLHRGDVVTYARPIYSRYGYGGIASLPTVLELNCGEELQTEQYVAYPQGHPDKAKYNAVCECAYELTKPTTKGTSNYSASYSLLEDEEELNV